MKLYNLRTLFFGLFVVTATMFTLWLNLLFSYDPFTAGVPILGAFYTTLFVFLGGFFTFVLYILKVNFTNNEIVYEHLGTSLRQGYIFSAIFVISLILRGLDVLNIFEFGIIAALGFIAELSLRSRHAWKSPSHN